jgi:hypothetical protein
LTKDQPLIGKWVNGLYVAGMTDITSNERAFIKISQDLIRRQNDLEMLIKLEAIGNNVSEYHRRSMSNIDTKRTHSEPFAGLSMAVALMSDATKMKAEINKARDAIEKLRSLADAFMRGDDIVQTRLSMD